MLLVPRHGEPLEQLANGIRLAAEPNRSLMQRIVAECGRFAVLSRAGKAPYFDAWCKSGAWVEAALTLVASELPNWSIRRLVKDDGTWFCSLSRSPNTPFEFDDMVEVSHEEMPLAILLALVEAKRTGLAAAPVAGATPDFAADVCHRMCCDNFA
jgi:hypothetical protein